MELDEIKFSIKKILTDIVSKESNGQGINLGDEDSLIDSGFIDSLGAIQAIEAFSEKFDLIIYPAELSLDNFDSINKISQFIASKLDGVEV
ncbi:MAG TPA: acyl carrier protein [Nitrospirota bacterium]|nr:acyl carrier protein [Nitrospirota bacterium]